MVIYGLCDSGAPGVIRYVGKSVSPKLRLQNHIRRPGKTHNGNWIRKVMAEGRSIEQVFIAYAVTEDAANYLEQYYIRLFRELGFDLTNDTNGGDGRLGFRPSQESIEKTASSHRGRKRSPETCARISAAKKGRSLPPFSEEHKAKIAAANRDKLRPYLVKRNKIPWSEERRAKHSVSQLQRYAKERGQEEKLG